MAQNIDELQIEIESDATHALDGLENLAKSLEKLKKAVGGGKDTAAGLKTLIPALRSLSKLSNLNLTANIEQLKALNSVIKSMNSTDFTSFGDKVNAIAGGITQLTNLPAGNISAISGGLKSIVKAYNQLGQMNLDFGPQLSAISSGISTLSATSESLNKVNFDAFGTNIDTLSQKLQPLQGFKSQAASLLNALRSFPEAAAALNNFDSFDQFGEQMDKLKDGLEKVSGINSKLGATLDALTRVNQVSNNLNSIDFKHFHGQMVALSDALKPLENVNSKLGSTLNNLSRVGTVATELSATMKGSTLKHDINQLAKALSGLNKIEKGNLGSVIRSLKQIPDITKSLDTATLDAFAVAIQRLTGIMAPLAAELRDVHNGFSLLPMAIREAIRLTEQATTTNHRARKSFSSLTTSITRTITKLTVLGFFFKRVWNVMADAFNASNDYIETMNLFAVSMGEYADEAREYARTVQDLLGIDMAEWMNNQAVFMQTLTGFGIASDEAAQMSRVLTQLGYDFSSLWNADVELVMQRLESAMTGQIKGMKNYGKNVSVAALQETALALGIEQSVRSMTEAQKAQLRYITIMRNTDGILGDLAKTINSPANAMRVLNSQLKRLKRAFGDIVSVIVTQFIPYMQAIVEIVTEMAENLAISLGFEIEDLPSNVLQGTGTMKEDLEDASDEAKELQKQLMGFDELNILKSPEADKDTSNTLGLDMSIYDYDFFSNLNKEHADAVKAAKEQILEMVDGLKEVAKWAAIAGGIFIGWKIATGFATGMNAISTLLGGGKGGSKKKGAFKLPAITTILKGMAELAIIVGGAVVLVEALGLLMKIPGFEETAREGVNLLGIVFEGLFDIAVPLGLAAVACNLLGKAGVSNIAKGFAGFAIVVGGTAALVTAVGALLSIPGFDSFLSTGVSSLKEVFNGLYDIAVPVAKLSAGLVGLGIASPSLILSGFGGFAIIIGGTAALITAIGALMSIPSFGGFLSTGIGSVKDVFNGLYEIAVPIGLTSALVVALGFASPALILSGFAGFATIIGGTTGLVTALGAMLTIPGFDAFLSTGMTSIQDVFNSLYDIALPIGALSALIVGLGFVSPGVVLSGLAGFAAIVGGIEVLLVALGALKQIPGFTWIVEEGKSVLMQVGDTIGGFAGSIVGGFAAEASKSLPEIGQNLADFMSNASPFFTGINSVNANSADAAKGVVGVIMALMGADILDGLTSWITGGSSLVKFGEQLSAFAPHFVEYADTVSGINAEAVTASANAAMALSELANGLPNSGGLAGWFAGENDIDTWGAKLPAFGRNLKAYALAVSGFNEDAVASSANAAQAMSELANGLPNSGGLAGWFAGENDIDTWGAKLPVFGRHLKSYAAAVAGLNGDAVTASANAALALAALANNLPNSGGMVAWFTGDNDLTTFGQKLPGFGGYIKQYADAVAGVDASAVTASANAAKTLAELAVNLPNSGGLAAIFAGDNSLATFGEMLPGLGADLQAFSNNASGVNLEQSVAAVNLLDKIVGVANKASAGNGFDALIGKLGELADALNNLKMPKLRNLRMNVSFQTSYSANARKVFEMAGLPGAPVLTWNAYANGGFPAMGEMFIARERGPEMVGRIGNKTAVANNEQITTGIASAVYSAMMAAHEDSGSGMGGGNGTARVIVQIGERAVGEAAVEFINGQIRQTGKSPIYA